MEEYNNIFTNKLPTSLDVKEDKKFTIELLDDFLQNELSGKQYELYKDGKVVEGNKQSKSLDIIRSILKKEIDLRCIQDKEQVFLLTKLEKVLDDIFDIIDNIDIESDNRYYILGTIIKSLYG